MSADFGSQMTSMLHYQVLVALSCIEELSLNILNSCVNDVNACNPRIDSMGLICERYYCVEPFGVKSDAPHSVSEFIHMKTYERSDHSDHSDRLKVGAR